MTEDIETKGHVDVDGRYGKSDARRMINAEANSNVGGGKGIS